MKAEDFVEKFLQHYASEYYDPAKAHDYYLRNRELTGRKKGMSDQQKEGWSYAKGQINEAEKRDVETASTERKDIVDRARETAQARRDAIGYKLRTLLEALSAKRKSDADQLTKDAKDSADKLEADLSKESIRIREDAAQKIAGVPAIPKGITGEQRTKLEARRAEEISKIRGTAFDDLVKLSDEGAAKREALSAETDQKREALSSKAQTDQQTEREKATADREAVRTELKTTVDKARADYESKRDALKAKYDAAAQQELEGIRNNLPSAPDKSSSKKKKSKDKHPPRKTSGRTMSLQEAAQENVRRLGLTVPKR